MPARGRYIRCSAATSVTIGKTLDVGARMRKNHAPAIAHGERRTIPHTVATNRLDMAKNNTSDDPVAAAMGHS
jgi:hypothetical protein